MGSLRKQKTKVGTELLTADVIHQSVITAHMTLPAIPVITALTQPEKNLQGKLYKASIYVVKQTPASLYSKKPQSLERYYIVQVIPLKVYVVM